MYFIYARGPSAPPGYAPVQ